MLKNIRHKIAETYLIRQALANKHQRQITSFDEIKTIGIVYDATMEDSSLEIKKITKKLIAMGKSIYTLGFVDKKAIPEGLEPNTNDDYFCRNNLQWHLMPIKERTHRFTNEPFDYLLNLYSENKFPLLSISAQSKAKCRIGTFHKKYTECNDIMLADLEGKSASELLDAYILYLYKLKND